MLHVNQELDGGRWDALAESDAIDYEAMYDDLGRADARESGAGGEGGEGFAADTRDAGAQRAGGGDGARDPQFRAAGLDAFDDPHGKGAEAQIESVAHDLRADPNVAAKLKQQAELKANSPMQAKVDQESTIGAPLFDAADQPSFRLDTEGDPVNPVDLLAEIEADDAAIATVKDCLK